jgi:peptidoglycan/LPS O-acetylase OafA/YrhL
LDLAEDAMKTNSTSGWLPQLDGLRGLSILMVLTAHVYAPGWHELQGGYGVTVFFVLSGFLITQLLCREERDTGAISLSSFYVRRAFRLFPIYYLILAVYCVLIFVLHLRPDGRAGFADALPWYLVYLQDFPYFRDRSLTGGHIAVPFYQTWSLGIEEKFYLLWPIVAFRLLRVPRGRIYLAAAAAILFSSARFFWAGRFIFPYAAICWGCFAALLFELPKVRESLARIFSSWQAPVILLSWPLVHVAVAWSSLPTSVQLWAELGYPLAIACVIFASLSFTPLVRALSWKPLTVLGRYSYSIYLVHLLVRQGVDQALQKLNISRGSGFLVYLFMLLISTLVAAILYYTVESPCRDLGRRLSNSWKKKSAATSETSTARLDNRQIEPA